MIALLGLALVLTTWATAEEPKEKPAAEKLLIGQWKMVKQNGQPLPDGVKIAVEVGKDNKLKVMFEAMGKKDTLNGTWSIKEKTLTTTVTKEGKETITVVEIKTLDEKTFIYVDKDKIELEFERVMAEKK